MAYPGGKGGDGVYQAIINQMPPHDEYCEPFAGGASILRMKRPAKASIAIDKDADAVKAIVSANISGCTAVLGDGIRHIEASMWTGKDLIYCDPPYPLESRRQNRQLYRYQFSDADHVRFLEAVLQCNAMVMVSSYDSPLYRTMLRDWRLLTFNAATRQGSATEYLWMNYPEPTELHDYRYLGKDYRERERIKRKVTRWRRRIDGMNLLERRVLANAVREAALLDGNVDEPGGGS